jgi:micrococcal nuclease
MKRIIKLMIFLLIIAFTTCVQASSGPIKQNSIISCNGKYYGNHGNPIHWHEVVKKDDKWVSVSKETTIPACYIKEVNEKELVTFDKCSDGDTAKFMINGEEKKVRFLAIDTPEIDTNEPFSKEASEYTCNRLKNAKEIYLEYDSNSDREDKYGRVLAFVHVDGSLLQKELIERGYAKVAYIYGDYEYVSLLKEQEEIAKNNQLGIWAINLGDIETKEEDNDSNDDIILRIINTIIAIIKFLFDLFIK